MSNLPFIQCIRAHLSPCIPMRIFSRKTVLSAIVILKISVFYYEIYTPTRTLTLDNRQM